MILVIIIIIIAIITVIVILNYDYRHAQDFHVQLRDAERRRFSTIFRIFTS